MLQKPNNKRFGNGASESSLAEREALLAEREASLAKREAALRKREACLSSKKGSKRRPARFLDEDGNEVSLAELLSNSPLAGLGLDFSRR